MTKNSLWLPHTQICYAPFISSFGGGSVRGFNPGGGGAGGNNFALTFNGYVVDSGGVSGYTFFTKTTDGDTSMVVPSDTGITSLRIELRGGEGGNTGGKGATVIVTADLTHPTFAGNTFYFVNGGKGGTQASGYESTGGYNGGGNGIDNQSQGSNAGAGGGATDMRTTNPNGNPSNNYLAAGRILVAGAGGGGTNNGATGANGGWPEGGTSADQNGGQGHGGTQTEGGSYGGSFGQGGTNRNNTGWNGGGGGGWYGGGAHETQHYAGGGGSSYTSPIFTVVSRTGPSNSSHTGQGYLKVSLS